MGEIRKKIIAEVDAEGHVPKIGQRVYVLYGNELSVETVHSIGRNTFVIEAYRRANIKFEFGEWRYKDYGTCWFTSFEDAEKELMSRFPEGYGLVKYNSTWYGVERL